MDDSDEFFTEYFGDNDELLNENNLDLSDADGFIYRPLWTSSYGFRDLRKTAIAAFTNLIDAEMPQDIRDWDFTDDGAWLFKYREVYVKIEAVSTSATFLSTRIIPNKRKSFSRNATDTVQLALKRILHIYGPQLSSFQDVAILMLKLLEETTDQLSRFRGRAYRKVATFRELEAWNPFEVKSWASIRGNPHGVDLNCITDTAFHVLKKTPKQICEDLPPEFRVLHVESVLRSDLAARFLEYQAKLRQKLKCRSLSELARYVPHGRISRGGRAEMEDTLDYLVEPRVTFHGTIQETIHSIVRYGFTRPGAEIGTTGEILNVRCGNTYGRGIYVSPNPEFSMCYSPEGVVKTRLDCGFSNRILICATIMGRARRVYRHDNRRGINKPMENCESHMGNNDLEYVVFNSAAILPCYVVHFDDPDDDFVDWLDNLPSNPDQWTQRAQRVKRTHPKLKTEVVYAGDKVREQERKKAAALKWLPYGYGPAQGTSFVIEEVGEVSEDEEGYGEFWRDQAAVEDGRREKLMEKKEEAYKRHLAVNSGKTSLFDEYYIAAKSDKKLPDRALDLF